MLHPDIHHNPDDNNAPEDVTEPTSLRSSIPNSTYNTDREEVVYPPTPPAYRTPADDTNAVPASPLYDQSVADEPYPPTPQSYQTQHNDDTTTSTRYPGASQSEQYGNFPPHNSSFGTPPAQPPLPPRSRGLRTGAILLLALLLAAVFAIGLFAGWQFGRTSNATDTSSIGTVGQLEPSANTKSTIPPLSSNNITSVREAVIANVRPAVVQINVTTQQGTALGSGVIIDKRGYIVTNNHVVNGATSIDTVVLADGTKIRNAQLIGTDPADDLAVIKINPTNNITAVSIGDSSQLNVGQDVLAIGNPLGNTQTVTSGIVSALNRNVSEGNGGPTLPNAIQTDAPINPGNSGGALVDLQGHLIGIPTLAAVDPEFNAPANGVGFAIPSNRVALVVPQIIQNGKVTHTGRAALGISAASVDPSVQAQDNLAVSSGVLVADLTSGGAAGKAGILVGDVITQIDDKVVTDQSSLQNTLISKNPGDTVKVHIYRGSQQLTISVTLGELQSGSK